MPDKSEKKNAIITGGSRGIGRAISIEMAAKGYYVFINYKSNEIAALETLNVVKSDGGDGEIVGFDVTDSGAVENFIDNISKRFKNDSIPPFIL